MEGGLEDCPFSDGIIKSQEGTFPGLPVFTDFSKGPSILGAYSLLGYSPGHSVIPSSAFIPQLLFPFNFRENGFAEYKNALQIVSIISRKVTLLKEA